MTRIARNTVRAAVWALLLGLTNASALAAGPVKADGGIVFSLNAPGAQAVFLAGDFNGWNASDLPLAGDGSGNWSVTVKLAAGTYEYKFIVDGDWREDAGNPERKSDPFGGSNSVVTVRADGTLAGGAAAPAATAPAATPATKPAANTSGLKVGRPRAVDGGIAFTFKAGDAGRVTLAGTFNGWNAEDSPLTSDGKGTWSIVKQLDAGQHEYKFVVDGNWLADPENPDTVSDPYGGANSVVTVDAKGQLTATVAAAPAASNNTLNAKVVIDGRYLTRFEFAKNVPLEIGAEAAVDPRYRLQRPTQSVDLNFHTEVSDIASTFMRLRLDSDQNIIQNNVAAILDEGGLQIRPDNFSLAAYWNREMFTGEDLLGLGGNLDLPGTLLHDHLDYGKGTAGALFTADPLGLRARFFFANAHNNDYYNDPDLYDNLGEDRVSLRLSKNFAKFEIGTPFYMQRSLVWLDFGTLPAIGIPSLNEHRANTGDTSAWYEVDTYQLNAGLDLRYHHDERWTFGAEALYRESIQRFATGNLAGQNSSNGAMDVPFLERTEKVLVGQADYRLSADHNFQLRHQMIRMRGGDPGQRQLTYGFLPQVSANKQVTYQVSLSGAEADVDSTELTWNWARDDRMATVWLRRAAYAYAYGAVGRTAPEDSTVDAHTARSWYLAGRVGRGLPADRFGHVELEAGFDLTDRGVAGLKHNRVELILRYDRDLTRNTGLIADLRYARYHLEGQADGSDGAVTDTDYFNPFVGIRYAPIRKLELVAGYGVDPVDYSIDYDGRQLGRWMYRQNYLFDHPDATNLEAENFLKKARVVTLRAQLQF